MYVFGNGPHPLSPSLSYVLLIFIMIVYDCDWWLLIDDWIECDWMWLNLSDEEIWVNLSDEEKFCVHNFVYTINFNARAHWGPID